jgi:hypothetical protein
MAEQTATAAPQEERRDRKSLPTLPLSGYLRVWSRNEGEVLRMAEQTATAAHQTESLTSQIYLHISHKLFSSHIYLFMQERVRNTFSFLL